MTQPKAPDLMDDLRQMFDGSAALRERMKTQVDQTAQAHGARIAQAFAAALRGTESPPLAGPNTTREQASTAPAARARHAGHREAA